MRTVAEVMLILKGIRNRKGISISEAADYIQEATDNRVSKKTLYGWEEGTSKPDIVSFMALCNLYDIRDIRELFEGESVLLEDVDVGLRDRLYRGYVKSTEYHEAIDILLGLE